MQERRQPIGSLTEHLLEQAQGQETFRDEVIAGLSGFPRTLPCKYFYDERGAHLFERICKLEEYYPTRTELSIMREHVREMAAHIGPEALLIEYGSGEGLKTRILLDALERPAGYVPLDISCEQLALNTARLLRRYPRLEVLPVCTDYTSDFAVPVTTRRPARRVVYFPGSTIGNFTPSAAHRFLTHARELTGPGGGLLIGVDLQKNREILERAYNDAEGVTAAFNLNLLRRINRELGADFDLRFWRHHAFYNEAAGRIEMHLVSKRAQIVRIDGHVLRFAAGETIHTENSYKYGLSQFAARAAKAGWAPSRIWTDPQRLFSVQYLMC
jgi:dimethylhistidine N-methyltransferase